MAVDLHLLQQFQPGDSPIFRLYSWERPTLSLGRNEKIDQGINLDFCREEQIPLIRRMTGGKAVLHQSDLTYSIIGELGDPQFFLLQGFGTAPMFYGALRGRNSG